MSDQRAAARIRLQAAPALLLWIGLVYGLVEFGTVLGWSSAAWSLSFGLVAGGWVGFWSWWAGRLGASLSKSIHVAAVTVESVPI